MFSYHKCEHVLLLAFAHPFLHPKTLFSYKVQNDSISLSLSTPKTLFPLHSTLVSRYPKEPVLLWTCFSVSQLDVPIFTCHLHFHSPKENVMTRRNRRKNWGLLNKGLKKRTKSYQKTEILTSLLIQQSLLLSLTTFPLYCARKKKSNAYTFPVSSKLTLPGVEQELLA